VKYYGINMSTAPAFARKGIFAALFLFVIAPGIFAFAG
jgi:hypothetical protein